MKFEDMLKELKAGKKASNENWNGLKNNKKMYIDIQYSDWGSKNTEPYIMFHSDDRVFPWTPSALDMFSDKWGLI